jgi:hypothetical protein
MVAGRKAGNNNMKSLAKSSSNMAASGISGTFSASKAASESSESSAQRWRKALSGGGENGGGKISKAASPAKSGIRRAALGIFKPGNIGERKETGASTYAIHNRWYCLPPY